MLQLGRGCGGVWSARPPHSTPPTFAHTYAATHLCVNLALGYEPQVVLSSQWPSSKRRGNTVPCHGDGETQRCNPCHGCSQSERYLMSCCLGDGNLKQDIKDIKNKTRMHCFCSVFWSWLTCTQNVNSQDRRKIFRIWWELEEYALLYNFSGGGGGYYCVHHWYA